IKEIFTIAKEVGALTILDSAQSLGLIDLTIENIDFLAFAGHKTLYGPFGIGGFINNSDFKLKQYIVGGTGSNSLVLDMPEESPNRYEAASSNIVAIAGLQAALKELNVDDNYRKEKELTEYARERIGSVYRVKLYLPENKDNHIAIISFNLMIPDNSAANVGAALDEDYGIAVRTGYHCAPYVHDLIMDKEYNGTVRVGLGRFNTREDIDALCDALEEMV
ncbi:MAG: aminotransferase class V-fold PLP-dependent enzyme, partial [Lachnospiraceae bacterium]